MSCNSITIDVPANTGLGRPGLRIRVQQPHLLLRNERASQAPQQGHIVVDTDLAGLRRNGIININSNGNNVIDMPADRPQHLHPARQVVDLGVVWLPNNDDDDDGDDAASEQSTWLTQLWKSHWWGCMVVLGLSLVWMTAPTLLSAGRSSWSLSSAAHPFASFNRFADRPLTPTLFDIRLGIRDLSKSLASFSHDLATVVSSAALRDNPQKSPLNTTTDHSFLPPRSVWPQKLAASLGQDRPAEWTRFLPGVMDEQRQDLCRALTGNFFPWTVWEFWDKLDLYSEVGTFLSDWRQNHNYHEHRDKDTGEQRAMDKIMHVCFALRNITRGEQVDITLNEQLRLPLHIRGDLEERLIPAHALSEGITWLYPHYWGAKFEQRLGSIIQGFSGLVHGVGIQAAHEWESWLILGAKWANGGARVYSVEGGGIRKTKKDDSASSSSSSSSSCSSSSSSSSSAPPSTPFNTLLSITLSLQVLQHITESLDVRLEQVVNPWTDSIQFIADDITELIHRGWLLDHFDQVLLGLSDAYVQGGKDAASSTTLPSHFAEVTALADELRKLGEWNRNVYLVELDRLGQRVQKTLQSVLDAQHAVARLSNMLEVMLLSKTRIRLEDSGGENIKDEGKIKSDPLWWLSVRDKQAWVELMSGEESSNSSSSSAGWWWWRGGSKDEELINDNMNIKAETTDAVIQLLRLLGPAGTFARTIALFQDIYGDAGLIWPWES